LVERHGDRVDRVAELVQGPIRIRSLDVPPHHHEDRSLAALVHIVGDLELESSGAELRANHLGLIPAIEKNELAHYAHHGHFPACCDCGRLAAMSFIHFSSPSGASAQRFDEAPKLGSRLGSGTVAVISIPLAFRRATASAVHSADLPTSHSRRTTRLARPF
jgi:hypothetical protein